MPRPPRPCPDLPHGLTKPDCAFLSTSLTDSPNRTVPSLQERPREKQQDRARAGTDYENQAMCQVCWGEDGDLLCCDFCPGAYHPACIGIDNIADLPNTWSCPHHKCTLCQRRANAAGGLPSPVAHR